MSNTYYYSNSGRRVESGANLDKMRYNSNTAGRHKSKSKSTKKLWKYGVGALVLFTLVGFGTEYSKVDAEMTREEGTEVTQTYSPSGGIDIVYHGKKQHTLSDVVERVFDNIKQDIRDFESKFSDGIDDTMSRGQ